MDLNHLKIVLRSILVSSPGSCTISQLLNDYVALEGQHLPYKQLGFDNVLDVFKNMNDVLKVPNNPSMNSFVELNIVQKSDHIRQLVSNQKMNKKKRPSRKHYPNASEYCGVRNEHGSSNNYNKNANEYCTPRGYDFVKKSPVSSSKNNGFVTSQLRKSIEYLCENSQSVSVRALKNCLVNHPDYNLLKAYNIEEAINLLKYFIYIDKNGVHLKNSTYEIFSNDPSNLRNTTRPVIESSAQSITNEEKGLLKDDYDYEDYSFSLSEYYENLDIHQGKYDKSFETQQKNEKSCEVPSEAVDNQQSINNNTFETEQKNENSYEMPKVAVDNQEFKNNNTFETEQKNENSYEMPKVAVDNQEFKNNNTFLTEQKTESLCEMPKIQSKTQLRVNEDEKQISDSCNRNINYYKNAITSIIMASKEPVTIDEVLMTFKIKYNYCFPIQKFSCRTVMDFFRLYPALFLLSDPYSTNSIIEIGTPMIPTLITTNRKNYINASNYMYENENNFENMVLIQNENTVEPITDISPQKINENVDFGHFSVSSDSYNEEVYDSDMILDSMKKKMSSLLTKHKDGILCNAFMDIYGKEYNTYFTYSEYGFKSMRDMAYNLPSVFYVKVNEFGDSCLYSANRRNELNKDCQDPSQYYKKIPKSILRNLAEFFDEHRSGIQFHQLKPLYCSKFGRSYEPLKYGYSSEKHMFESLDKMVKFDNDIIYTLDPYAYIHFENNENSVKKSEKTLPVLPVNDYLLNYSGNDVCCGKFVYPELKLDIKKVHRVVAAEIYNPSSFYLHLSQSIGNLNTFMNNIQLFYDNNEDKYRVLPELITAGLACASCFEDSQQWHRAKVINVVDEHNVKLLYVDYGSIETISKSNVRLLERRFGVLPAQGIHCSLYECKEPINYSREINEKFALMIDNKVLDAQFHNSKTEKVFQKSIVTLFVKQNNNIFNVNTECSKEIVAYQNRHGESIRRLISKLVEDTSDISDD